MSNIVGLYKSEDLWALGKQSKVVCSGVRQDADSTGIVLDLDYPLLGTREYAHGSSMFEGMVASLLHLEPGLDGMETLVRRYKIVRSSSHLSRAVAMETAKAKKHPDLKNILARMDIVVGQRELSCLLFPRSEVPQSRLFEYNPAGFIDSLDDDRSIGELNRMKDFVDLFRAINECNRLLTIRSFPFPEWSKRVRLAYIENLPLLSASVCASVRRVRFIPSETLDLGNHRFVIKKGTLEFPGGEREFSICFFIELPVGEMNGH